MGKKRIEDFVNAQTEFLDTVQEANRVVVRSHTIRSELRFQLASKLTAARSIPDAMTACQEWSSRRFEMMAEDGKHLLSDTQKFMETGAHLLANG